MSDGAPKRRGPGPGAQLPHFSRSLPMSLLRGREAVMRRFRPVLRRHRITEQQWRVLRALSAVETIEVAALARTTCLLGPSLSRILADLEARGFIARTTDPADLRRGYIAISRDGRRLIDTVSPESEAIYGEIVARFGAGRLADLQTMLAMLEESLVEENDG